MSADPHGFDPAAPAPVPVGPDLADADLQPLLERWLPQQRWYAGDTAAGLTIESRQFVGDVDWAAVEHLVLGVPGTDGSMRRYQLWLGWRDHLPDRLGHSAIGAINGRTCYDALADRSISAMLLDAIAHEHTLGEVTAYHAPDAVLDVTAPGLVIGAEQSNTSVVYGDSAILKVFRSLQPGPNPDLEVSLALHAAGSTHIADPLGYLEGPVAGEPTTLALLTTFFANSAEGWAMATASVRDLMAEGDLHADEVGGDFAAEAHRLGHAVAAVHQDLADAFGTRTVDRAGLDALITEMESAATLAAEQAPVLADHLPAILSVFDHARDAGAGLVVQRIHGDLHLGQTLRTLTGWVIIDFEGEPSRSLEVRRGLQSPLKDVAGMLRSFDYAARMPLVSGQPDAQHVYRATEWAERNRAAFCAGYAEASATDPRQALPLLRAFELDKAVYEVLYESAHRPTWVVVPMHAITTLTSPGAVS
jgi:maltokinase